jgi:hypothetical protein
MGWPLLPNAREDKSVWMPPNVFRVRMCSLTPISGPAAGSRMRCGAATSDPIAEVPAGIADALHLRVFGVRVGHLQVPGLDLTSDGGGIQQRFVGEGVHLRHQRFKVVGDDEVGAVAVTTGEQSLDVRRVSVA